MPGYTLRHLFVASAVTAAAIWMFGARCDLTANVLVVATLRDDEVDCAGVNRLSVTLEGAVRGFV
jgi:hypothetical protein